MSRPFDRTPTRFTALALPRIIGSVSALFLLTLLTALMSAGAWAADDPPGRIGRLARVTGNVWLYDDEERDWDEAQINQPLTSGDRLSVASDARAIVQVGSTTLYLDSGTELEFLRIDDAKIQVQLHGGTLAAQVVEADVVPEIELLAGESRFFPRRTGQYRLDRRDGITHAGVWAGELIIPDLSLAIQRGQRLELWQESGQREPRINWQRTVPDAFSDWVARSQDDDRRSVTQQYVSPEMTGWADLDRHGRWETHPEYGPVWAPVVGVEWAPFQFGRWVWVRPWGWTWVDQQPWGFAPFHYGRWVQISGRWFWAPGQRIARPLYAPALVTWPGSVSTQISIHIGNGPPGGWVPLSPYDIYHPYYRSTPVYRTIINRPHHSDYRDDERNSNYERDSHSAYRNPPVIESIAPARPGRDERRRDSSSWPSGRDASNDNRRDNDRGRWQIDSPQPRPSVQAQPPRTEIIAPVMPPPVDNNHRPDSPRYSAGQEPPAAPTSHLNNRRRETPPEPVPSVTARTAERIIERSAAPATSRPPEVRKETRSESRREDTRNTHHRSRGDGELER